MKYNILLNQIKAVEWGLSSSEAIVLSWIYELPSWAKRIEYDGNFYFHGNRNEACNELPIVTEKSDTMYRIYKSLSNKGIVNIICINKQDYLSLTEKGKEWYMSEKNPSNGNKSDETRKKIRENSEKNPTYNNTNNNNTKDNIKEDTNVSKKVTNIIRQEDVDYLYSLYPSKCPTKNKSNGKGASDKIKIRSLLKTMPKEELEFTIKAYVQQCTENGEWMKNFSTFLKNLPDMGYCKEEEQQQEIRSSRKIEWQT